MSTLALGALFIALVISAGVLWEMIPAILAARRYPEPSTTDWLFDEDGHFLSWSEAQVKKERQLRDEGKL